MTPEQLLRRLRSDGPKRILALDGGGVRGTLSLAILARIEALLRDRHGRPDLRLSDYFDLIGGTSTGSIIAACLAVGMEVGEVAALYREHGPRVFARRRLRFWQSLYDERPLEALLEVALGDATLGGAELRTGLAVVTKRADTNSTWPLLNHPEGKFYEANRAIRVRDAVRASAAAPVLFRPGEDRRGRRGHRRLRRRGGEHGERPRPPPLPRRDAARLRVPVGDRRRPPPPRLRRRGSLPARGRPDRPGQGQLAAMARPPAPDADPGRHGPLQDDPPGDLPLAHPSGDRSRGGGSRRRPAARATGPRLPALRRGPHRRGAPRPSSSPTSSPTNAHSARWRGPSGCPSSRGSAAPRRRATSTPSHFLPAYDLVEPRARRV